MSSTAAVHRLQVQSLYKRSLKLSLDWYIQRDLWRQKALEIRARFEQNKNVTNPKEIRALLKKTENELKEWAHPDPYRLPTGPDGTKWERNLPPVVQPNMSSIHKSPITCHVLIASLGIPGKEIDVKIEKLDENQFSVLSTSQTNNDGRCPNLLPQDYKVEKGIYRVTFETKEYFEKLGQACFYPYVQMGEQMTPSQQFIAKRWFIVGAYQAGATDKVISDMVGLSTASVHNVITQFKKTGSPICKRLSSAERREWKGRYDEYGHIINSEDELVDTTVYTKLKLKKTRPKRPSAKDLINYVLVKANPQPNSIVNFKEEEEEEKQAILLYQNKWRPPTPPYNPQQQQEQQQQQQQQQQQEEESNSESLEKTNLLSPPLSESKAEHWTAEEDRILMAHLLTRLSSERWHEAA
ncbi:hypothetical protein G6F43_000641 [Rhizopus delemar]|nr:hypothetical protein G6F43_000641 [Rhizopus delemar]